MINVLMVLILILGAMILAYFLGPRPEFALDPLPVQLDEDLDHYIQAAEARYTDITPGAEKKIFWANPTKKQQTEYALVYIHGFSASRQELSPVPENIAASLSANLFCTRLRGHGRKPSETLGEATLAEWLHDTREALEIGRQLGRKVILMGTSTGASLLTWLMAEDSMTGVAGAILLSPNFSPKDKKSWLVLQPWGRQLLKLMLGEFRKWDAGNSLQEQFWSTRYPASVLIEMMGAVNLAKNSAVEHIKLPLLILYSPRDEVVSVTEIQTMFRRFGSDPKALIAIESPQDGSAHVLAGDILSPATNQVVASEILQFIDKLSAATSQPDLARYGRNTN
ncbi:lysophospholipase [Oleiphilus messinensis]|uniref:Lysophospholipase n=1 Tax=Oleiphilus messinensis TaxID=141451 RepID=A0A1Y0I6U9_9GAMM|nr:alpha/beta fold hydrolase [Oleiphilus messinensis]ARU55506.1 lysophospholipase [Oleiphilus messinensis]